MKHYSVFVTVLSLIFCQSALAAPWITAHTNLTDGSTLDVSSDLDITSSIATSSKGGRFAGVLYTNNASITGAGNVFIENNSAASNTTDTIYGVYTSNSGVMTNSGFTGNLTVENDRSAAPTHDSNSADAYGVYGNWVGDWAGDMTVTAISGMATNDAEAHAYGFYGGVDGNLVGDVTVVAQSGGTSQNARLCATGVSGDVNGDVIGSVAAQAIAGNTFSTNTGARAHAAAYGISGSVSSNVTGDISVKATAGEAISTYCKARAFAKAYGAYNVGGDISGDIIVTATGGKAYGGYDGGSYDSAKAYAEAYGISGSVAGDVSGLVQSIATAGEAYATATNNGAQSYASSYGISGRVDGDMTGTVVAEATGGIGEGYGGYAGAYSYGIGGVSNFSGAIQSTAVGGLAVAGGCSADADAEAYGIGGDVYGDLLGVVTATATGGTADGDSSGDASATAYGLKGDVDGVISGTITAIATAGLTNGASDTAEAYGIYGDHGDLTFSNATVSAQAYENDGTLISRNSYAVYNAGDVVFAGGNSRIAGNIIACNSVRVDSGTFTPVGRVQVDSSLRVGPAGTLEFELYGAPGHAKNSKLDVSNGSSTGTVDFDAGATVSVVDADGATLRSVIGSHELISSDGINGGSNINYEVASVFEMDFTVTSNALIGNVTGVKDQDSSAPAQVQAAASAANAVMSHISRGSGMARAAVRGGNGGAVAEPDGPGGPDVRSGEWTAYFRQFNDLGGMDSDGTKDGFDWQTSGYMLGMERLIQDQLIIGVAGGQAFTDIDGKRGSGGGASKMLMGTVYGNLFDDVKYLEAGLFYAQVDNDTERIDTANNRYTGDYDSTLFGCWIEAGYTIKQTDDSRIEPYIRSSYVSGNHDGFTDAGGPIPMTVSANGTDNWTIEGGARFSKTMDLKNGGSLLGELKAGLQAELLDNSVGVNTMVAGVNQKANGPDADRAALVLGLRLDWALNEKLTVGANYEPTLSGNWQNHALDFSVKYQF